MMNDLLRDMIEVEDIAVFIDDVMVGTETEKGYNNIGGRSIEKDSRK